MTLHLQEVLGRKHCANRAPAGENRGADFKVCPQQPVSPSPSLAGAPLPVATYWNTEGISVCQAAFQASDGQVVINRVASAETDVASSL